MHLLSVTKLNDEKLFCSNPRCNKCYCGEHDHNIAPANCNVLLYTLLDIHTRSWPLLQTNLCDEYGSELLV
jgi:hypothetical protein